MIIRGYGVIWDPERNRPAARFVDGEIRTDDQEICKLARLAGFSVETVPEEANPSSKPVVASLAGHTKAQLLAIAREAGIDAAESWTKTRLIEEIQA